MGKSRNDRNHQRFDDDDWGSKKIKKQKPDKFSKHEKRRLERAIKTRNFDELIGED